MYYVLYHGSVWVWRWGRGEEGEERVLGGQRHDAGDEEREEVNVDHQLVQIMRSAQPGDHAFWADSGRSSMAIPGHVEELEQAERSWPSSSEEISSATARIEAAPTLRPPARD